MKLEFKNVNHIYMPGTPFEKTALADINLSIRSGSFTGLIGHTGSGKSTLIQHLNGLLHPTSGQILVDGQDISEKKYDRRGLRFRVGLVFQYPEHQLFDETVFSDIAYGPKNMGLPPDEIERRVHEALSYVGLDPDILPRSPFELSGGQKRRVAIAGVLAMQPDVLILDEPTAGLDPRGRDEILGHICDLHKKTHNTVIFVSHSMEDVGRICDDIIVMKDGHIQMHDTKQAVFTRVDQLLEMNLDVPQITSVVSYLNTQGMNLPADIYTVEAAKQAILQATEDAPC